VATSGIELSPQQVSGESARLLISCAKVAVTNLDTTSSSITEPMARRGGRGQGVHWARTRGFRDAINRLCP
jgi:hypothetical protein